MCMCVCEIKCLFVNEVQFFHVCDLWSFSLHGSTLLSPPSPAVFFWSHAEQGPSVHHRKCGGEWPRPDAGLPQSRACWPRLLSTSWPCCGLHRTALKTKNTRRALTTWNMETSHRHAAAPSSHNDRNIIIKKESYSSNIVTFLHFWIHKLPIVISPSWDLFYSRRVNLSCGGTCVREGPLHRTCLQLYFFLLWEGNFTQMRTPALKHMDLCRLLTPPLYCTTIKRKEQAKKTDGWKQNGLMMTIKRRSQLTMKNKQKKTTKQFCSCSVHIKAQWSRIPWRRLTKTKNIVFIIIIFVIIIIITLTSLQQLSARYYNS